jgi:hypothetical protein
VGLAVITMDKVLDSAFAVINRVWHDGAVLEQMTLPQRHSGLGLHRTSLLEERVACHSAAAQAQQAVSGGLGELQPFEGPSGDMLWPLWEDNTRAPGVAIMPVVAQARRTYKMLRLSGMRFCWPPMPPPTLKDSAPWRTCAAARARPWRHG